MSEGIVIGILVIEVLILLVQAEYVRTLYNHTTSRLMGGGITHYHARSRQMLVAERWRVTWQFNEAPVFSVRGEFSLEDLKDIRKALQDIDPKVADAFAGEWVDTASSTKA